jgi:dephospho-CoA kinase
MNQRIIGLTGGIATGKTTVSDYLHRVYALPILDADLYAREAIDERLIGLLVQRYGQTVLRSDHTLDRAQLAQIIFRDRTERSWLESQIHPYVRDRLISGAAHHAPQSVVMAIPLLFEANMVDLVTEIWVVTCTPALELQRLMQRDRITKSDAQLRIVSQLPLSEKIDRADIVLDNSGTLAELYAQIDQAVNSR